MTTTMSSRGQIVIPQEVRKRCKLREGDHFLVEDDPESQVVVLRRVKKPGPWFDVYMECPATLELKPRKKQFYRKKRALFD